MPIHSGDEVIQPVQVDRQVALEIEQARLDELAVGPGKRRDIDIEIDTGIDTGTGIDTDTGNDIGNDTGIGVGLPVVTAVVPDAPLARPVPGRVRGWTPDGRRGRKEMVGGGG